MCADAGPTEILGVLMGSGVWGVVHEPADSGPFNAHNLDATAAILANIGLFEPLVASPPDLAVPGGEAGFGPRAFNISLAQARPFSKRCITLFDSFLSGCSSIQRWHLHACRRHPLRGRDSHDSHPGQDRRCCH